MTPESTKQIEQVVAQQHGGPVQLDGTNVVAMSTDVFREMMGIGTEEEMAASVAALQKSMAEARGGKTRPLTDALDDLGRRHEVQIHPVKGLRIKCAKSEISTVFARF